MSSSALPPIPVSDLLLKGITIRSTLRRHPVRSYARAFRGTPFLGVRVAGSGYHSIVIELPDATVLKITAQYVGPSLGGRPFDLPILGKGVLTEGNLNIYYYVQPLVQRTATHPEYMAFERMLIQQDYFSVNLHEKDLGIYEGQIKLLDPWSVGNCKNYI